MTLWLSSLVLGASLNIAHRAIFKLRKKKKLAPRGAWLRQKSCQEKVVVFVSSSKNPQQQQQKRARETR